MSNPSPNANPVTPLLLSMSFSFSLVSQRSERVAPEGFGSTTAAVDELLRRGQRREAEKYLDAVVGGHGVVTGQGLVITHPIQPWHSGRQLVEAGESRLEVLQHAVHMHMHMHMHIRASVMAHAIAPPIPCGDPSDTLPSPPLVIPGIR